LDECTAARTAQTERTGGNMISYISIKDFAIIENVEINFHPGLNIITGETGAGKSIVVEAISLALGSRADTAFVRSGKEKAIIQLAADLEDEEYIITRQISATGKNLCKINGEVVTLSEINTLCKRIADIHGQYDHQSLLNPEYHIRLVDSYHSDEILPAKEKTAALYQAYISAKNKMTSILNDAAEHERQQDFMRFELNEIHQSNLALGEDDALAEQISLLQNSETIYSNLAETYELVCESDFAAIDRLNKSLKLITEISEYSTDLATLSSKFSDVFYKLEDLFQEVRKQRDQVSFSPEELDACLLRMNLIDTLKRKYGGSIESILSYAHNLEEKLNLIENINISLETLKENVIRYEAELKDASSHLSKLRKQSAIHLEEKIQEELKQLNFNDSNLSIHFMDQPQHFTENGFDLVEFLISTNKGEPLKPLSKIASGGEMSRIMLAFKNIIADYDKIPTLIFDEIDSGISGITAAVVGKKMREISANHQIICITHLPQIAAYGHHNYRIAKEILDDMTITTVTPLLENEKIEEIARLLGGINITEITLQNARELIAQSK